MNSGEAPTSVDRAAGVAAPAFLSRRPALAVAAVITVAALAAYQTSFSVPFVFDDVASILRNPTIRHPWPWLAVLSVPGGGLTVSGRPVLNYTLALNYVVSGPAVWSYHALNLAIHILAGLTMFGIVRRTLQQPPLRARWSGEAPLLALVAALLWVVHPLQTEAVTYVVQRAESLMGLFYLLTLYGFIRAVDSPRPRLWQAGAVLACLLGMGTKEVMVTAPLMVLLYDRTFVAGSFREAWRRRRGLHVALSATWILLGWLVAGTGGTRGGAFAFTLGAAGAYWLTQFEAIVRYLGLAVWPHPLVFEYGPFWVHRGTDVAPYAVAVVPLAAATLVALRCRPVLGFLGAWFFAILAPTSLTPGTTEMIVEHRMYLPLAAVIVLGVAGLHRWTGRRGLAAGLALALGCGWLTMTRNLDYRSEASLWEDTVAKRPGNGLAHLDYGATLFDLGRYAEARAEFEQAAQIGPDDAETETNLGAALLRMGRPQEAVEHFERAVRLKPEYGKADYGLGLALFGTGQFQAAVEPLQRAIQQRPDDAELESDLAAALAWTGHPQEAVDHYEVAVRLKPGSAEAEYNLGSLLLGLGRPQEAAGHFAQAVRISPAHPDMLNNLAGALLQLGRTQEAIARYEQAVRLKPGRPDLHNNLGVALAKAGRLDEAIAQFREAIRLQPDYAEAHLTLALALTQTGREQEAEAERAEGLRLKSGRSPERR